MFITFERNVTDATWQKTKLICVSFAGRVVPHKDAAGNFLFTALGAKFDLHKQNFLAAVGRLRLIDARLNNSATGVHFDLSSPDPARIMVKPGKAPQYGDTFFELLRSVAPCLPILGPKILAAIQPASIDALLEEQISV